MAKITTKSGFTCDISPENLDDMELIDALADLEKGNTLSISVVVDKVLGEDQKKKLYDHVRADGKVPVERCSEEITEIFSALGKTGKN